MLRIPQRLDSPLTDGRAVRHMLMLEESRLTQSCDHAIFSQKGEESDIFIIITGTSLSVNV
jgi:hypothetical protein